ncbi:hypothetical protein ACHAW6_013279 [Cyclotella cf. meneghiniana]
MNVEYLLPSKQDAAANSKALAVPGKPMDDSSAKIAMTILLLTIMAARLYVELIGKEGAWGCTQSAANTSFNDSPTVNPMLSLIMGMLHKLFTFRGLEYVDIMPRCTQSAANTSFNDGPIVNPMLSIIMGMLHKLFTSICFDHADATPCHTQSVANTSFNDGLTVDPILSLVIGMHHKLFASKGLECVDTQQRVTNIGISCLTLCVLSKE